MINDLQMKKLLKLLITGLAAFVFSLPSLAAQVESDYKPYDPLVPQSFAFDKKHEIFAGINNVDNEIVIISRKDDGQLGISYRYLVDETAGRNDKERIYRPQSVAIYGDYIIFLASHHDGCYLAVLSLDGKLVNRLTFPGRASAFSFNPSADELYISGENPAGFDLVVLNTRNGIHRVEMNDALILHYENPHPNEEIAGSTTWSITGMSAITMGAALLALAVLFFREVDARLDRKRRKAAEAKLEPQPAAQDAVDGVYAAIAAAIHLYGEELHDVENTVLTINKASRTYSPWSSKIHGLNTYFSIRR